MTSGSRSRVQIQDTGGVADWVSPATLADPESIHAAVDHVAGRHGRLDGAFNNAGNIEQPGPLEGTMIDDLHRQFELSFRVQYLAMQHQAKLMCTSDRRRDVGLSAMRVNAMTPGATATEMMDAWEARSPGILEQAALSIALGRLATAEEVAEAACWLLSDRASAVASAIVPVDGGFGA